jgi:hypothetical protein
MSYTYETLESKNFIAKIVSDDTPESPREWDNLGTMICFHSRYNLGDDHNYDHSDYDGWDEMENAIRNEYGKDAIILPVFMYDHSGVSLSTTPFGCRWDSGQVGFIVVDRETVRKQNNWKKITKEREEKVISWLEGEVETYSNYLNGDVYGYEVYSIDEEGDECYEDSCYGYYYMDAVTEDAQRVLDWHQNEHNKTYGVQTELEVA